jgi:hypothetical protein
MKRLLLIASLMTSGLTADDHKVAANTTGPVDVSYVLSNRSIVVTANTNADYTDGIMFTVWFADGSTVTKLVHRNRLQREPSVAMVEFDPAKTKPLGVLAATLRSVYAARADVR